MNAPVRMVSITAVALLSALACRGDLVVNWLDEPLWLNADPPPIIGQPDRHDIDLDGNGTIDFSFSGTWHISVDFRSENSNRYLIVPDPPPNIGGAVAALGAGFLIGTESGDGSLDWFNHSAWAPLMHSLSTGTEGEFWGTRAYIGIEFQMDDGIHYGWFDVEGGDSGPYAVIRGWAYESTPSMGIIAGAIPEPSTLLLLLVGGGTLILRKGRIG